jgi:hypothetical protein
MLESPKCLFELWTWVETPSLAFFGYNRRFCKEKNWNWKFFESFICTLAEVAEYLLTIGMPT